MVQNDYIHSTSYRKIQRDNVRYFKPAILSICYQSTRYTNRNILENLMNNFYVSAHINFPAERQVADGAFCVVHMHIHVLF
jgi:hypothetical protein